MKDLRKNINIRRDAINIVALLKRGEKDGISLQGLPDAEQLAKEILVVLKTRKEKSSAASPGAWEIATNPEALNDSRLVTCNEIFLHYRTPTEKGSSGSPVFDNEFWEVVAPHHPGENQMPRLDGKEGTYEANEGVTVLAIKKAIENDM